SVLGYGLVVFLWTESYSKFYEGFKNYYVIARFVIDAEEQTVFKRVRVDRTIRLASRIRETSFSENKEI
ncbi:unnamed protein product, partial [Brachionus calyciflorus]